MADHHGHDDHHGDGPWWASLAGKTFKRDVQSDEGGISGTIWFTALSFVTMGVLSVLTFHFQGALLGAVGMAMIQYGWKYIPPADPPQIGLLTFWGQKLAVILHEGWVLLAPYFPFLVDVILVAVGKEERDYEFTVRCKGEYDDHDDSTAEALGGKVKVKVSVTHRPDYEGPGGGRRVINFINSGRKEGVEKILGDTLFNLAKNIATLYTWEEYIELRSGLNAALMMKMADSKFKLLPRDANGLISEDTFDKYEHDADAYAQLPHQRGDALEYLGEKGISHRERIMRQREIEVFLDIALINGGGNVLDLGTKMLRLQVLEIEPEGKLAEEADITSRMKKKREGLEMVADMNIDVARKYMDANDNFAEKGDLKFSQALQNVRTDAGENQEIIVNASSPLTGAAAVLGRQNKG